MENKINENEIEALLEAMRIIQKYKKDMLAKKRNPEITDALVLQLVMFYLEF